MTKTARRRNASRQEQALELFDQERDILLNGPLGELTALVAKREELVAELIAAAGPAPEGFLAALKSKVERNSRLLLASLAGLQAAQQQVEKADEAARTLRTYTAAGTSINVSEAPTTRDHRR